MLNGKELSEKIRKNIKDEIEVIEKKIGEKPGLAIILVGENPASKVYVNSKIKGCKDVGIESYAYFLEENSTEDEVLELLRKLNNDDRINGILVQLPLPKHINEKKIIDRIALEKDVDGFKPENLGLLMLNDKKAMVSCTPAGIMEIFKEYNIELSGKDVVIVGRSNIVGKPMASLLINASSTVTICNSKTKDLAEKTKKADIVIMAIGQPKFLKKDMVKEGAIIIDVGINRTEEGLCGDVDYNEVSKITQDITPVPGGVGPMTVTMLFSNTLKAFKAMKNID